MAKETQNNESSLIKKVWTLADILSGQGVAYTDYVTQLTYLLFLKMDQESEDFYGEPSRLPNGFQWKDLRREKGMDLVRLYEHILATLSNFHGLEPSLSRLKTRSRARPTWKKSLSSSIVRSG